MKMFKTLMLVAAAAMAFTGCSTDEFEDAPVSKNQTISFSSVVTRTAFGEADGNTYPTLWSGDETIRVGLNHAANNQATKETTITTEDNISASWTAEIEDDGSGAYTFYAMSPSVAFNSTRSDGWSVKVPEVQTPLDNSCDEAAQVLVAKSETYTEFPSSVSMQFQHFTAYGKLTLKNLNLNGATVQSIALTAEDFIVGRFNYTFASDEVAVNSAGATLTINTNKTENVWFAIRPCDLATSALKVVVTTDKGTFTKEVEVPEGCAFKAGVIANMTINMEGIAVETPETWSLVTDAAYLAAGDEVVIVAATANYAISTTQNGNNRGQAAIIKGSEDNTVTVGDGVQIFTLEAGTVAGSYAFNTGSGYIYAASSSSNYLRTETTLSANSSWDITIADGIATIKAKGTNTRNWLRYNSSSSIFSCYASGQKDVAIYKKGVIVPMDIFNVDKTEIEVSDLATSAAFAVNGNVAWTATITEGDATFDNGTTTMTGEGAATVNVNFIANTAAEAKTYKVTVSTDAEVETNAYEVVISQAAYTPPTYYVPVTAVTAGKKYLIVANNSGVYCAATPVASGNFGYLQKTEVTVMTEGIMSDDTTDALAFTINASENEGYNIIDSNSKYIYQTGTYNNFNVSTSLPSSGADWTIDIDADGLATITNTYVNKWVQYSTQYSSYGIYDTVSGILPQLYMLQE